MEGPPRSGLVGIIANPAAGKDIRRLVSAASPISDMAKVGIIRRAAIGAVEGGATGLLLADDRHALARRAVDGLELPVQMVDEALLSTGRDSQRAAAAMAKSDVGAVVVLGGDGTHRDVAKGWRRAPMVALSTGTNNVFPHGNEATMAGLAAGLVASGAVSISEAADDAKVIDVEITTADGQTSSDLGLVDLALTSGSFVGSRAVWDVTRIRELIAVIAEPNSVGLSAVAAAVLPTGRLDKGGVHLRLSADVDSLSEAESEAQSESESKSGFELRCAIAPGLFADVTVVDHRALGESDHVDLQGPAVLSFDGERDVVLADGDRARVTVAHDGPRVIDVTRTVTRAGHHARVESRVGSRVCGGDEPIDRRADGR